MNKKLFFVGGQKSFAMTSYLIKSKLSFEANELSEFICQDFFSSSVK